jgi:hypothetical protein
MRLTNVLNLPQPLETAIVGFEKGYQSGRGDTKISVTQLINPPLYKRLNDLHWDEIEEDVSERIWLLLGSAIHGILEKSAGLDVLAEERLFTEVRGWKVSGQADLYEPNGTLSDYKVTSIWSVKDDPKKEWEQQLNVLAYLYELAGFEVKKLQIVAILRDWSKGKSFQVDIPAPVKVIPIKKWTREELLKFLGERVALHQLAAQTDVERIPHCTPDERWSKPSTYAVMKHGRKSAVKVYDDLGEANAAASTDAVNLYVEDRPGQDVRCEQYCPVNKWCPYYLRTHETN